MRRGSVIVDLAGDGGGNVEGVEAGKAVVRHGVTLIGAVQLARSLAADSSALFARNLLNFVTAFWDKESRMLSLPDDDEIVSAIRLTRDGAVVSERLNA
jgi:NAD(P) transhydrogenase subunit alpha